MAGFMKNQKYRPCREMIIEDSQPHSIYKICLIFSTMSGSKNAIKLTAYWCTHQGSFFPAGKRDYAVNFFLQELAEIILLIVYDVK